MVLLQTCTKTESTLVYWLWSSELWHHVVTW